jgi:uncharacterized protein
MYILLNKYTKKFMILQEKIIFIHKISRNLRSLFFFLFSLSLFPLFAQTDSIPNKPNPFHFVNNYSATRFISSDEVQKLEQKLQAFSDSTSNQIIIIIIDDLGNMEPWEFATKLGTKWGVGQAKMDNGVVVLIKPSGGSGERKYFIAIGKGLEGAIPDITCRIIEERELVPNLKAENAYLALEKTTNVLMALASGEYNSKDYGKNNKLAISIIIGIFIQFVMLIIITLGIKAAIAKDYLTIDRRGSGSNSSSGSSSSSSSSSSSGGGSFGGGGSGGSW